MSMHGEVGENVMQENNDDVAMSDIAIHEAVTNDDDVAMPNITGVNKQPLATVNDVFRNTLADDTKHEDGISQLPHDVESGFLSDKQLRKLEIIRKDVETPLYPSCQVSNWKLTSCY